ncbi:EAL domain-containing protein [Ahrensia sp. R2A130]|uniref:EAL domain-containing protein n=1 Tax=Ahrensia sp. R2A130 TaxID=744979 RepID=UPI0001E0AC73|nr:EAL domain-containing protein [Ahrensia sp. R2A130]EFL90696.1 diguanylate cyclase/phosphodiesterase [Ahrensia sp. R2A130]
MAAWKRNHFLSLLGVLAIALVCSALQGREPLRHVQSQLTDMRSGAVERPATGDLLFLAIDKESVDLIGQWPWPRRIHATIIDKLLAAGVRDIAFDIDFSARSQIEDDRLLADALARADGMVILAAFQQAESIAAGARIATNRPIDVLLSHAWPASVNVMADKSGIVRSVPILQIADGEMLPSLPALLAGAALEEGPPVWIDYSIAPSSIPVHSVADLLNDAIPAGALLEKKVLVGASSVELRDTLTVPVHGLLPGTLVQALATETLMQDRSLAFTDAIWVVLLALTLCLLLFIVSQRRSVPTQMLLTLIVIGGLELVATWLQMRYALILVTAPIHLALILTGAGFIAIALYRSRILIARSGIESRDLRQILRQVVTDNFDAVLVCDPKGRVIFQSSAVQTVFGNHVGDVKRDNLNAAELLPEPIVSEMLQLVGFISDPTDELPEPLRKTRVVDVVDEQRHVEYVITPSQLGVESVAELRHRNSSRHLMDNSFVCLVARDVTADQLHLEEVQRNARFDRLTGAMNRAWFVECLDAAMTNEANNTVIFTFELHGMRAVNGTFGMDFGDRILVDMMLRLERFAPTGVSVARLEGDTFSVLLDVAHDEPAARELALDLKHVLEEPYQTGKTKAFIRSTMVMATSWQGHNSGEDYVRAGELALAFAHENPGPAVTVYAEQVGSKIQRMLKIERALWDALENDEFHLVYQPQVRLSDERVIGAEALVRWQSETLGPVYPDEFITVAERTGSIQALGAFVLDQACREALNWPEDTKVSVNASAAQLAVGDYVGVVERTLKSTGLPASRLTIELTESMLVADAGAALAQMRRLKAMGVSIALDDFGTGYSSLQYLSKLPVDTIKIDRAFVLDLERNEKAWSIIDSMLTLAKGMGIATCCEGIETSEHSDKMRDAGCTTAQGYLFGKPLSVDQFRAKLSQRQELAA